MKIAVGIPSFNEASNIKFVTQKVDIGLLALKKQFPNIEKVFIINVDNGSNDGTQEVFKNTKTTCDKIFGSRLDNYCKLLF